MPNTHFIADVEPTRTGFSAMVSSEGALTTGRTMNELVVNMVACLNLALADTGHVVTAEDIDFVPFQA